MLKKDIDFKTKLSLEIMEQLVRYSDQPESCYMNWKGPVGFKLDEQFDEVNWADANGKPLIRELFEVLRHLKLLREKQGGYGCVATAKAKNLFEQGSSELEKIVRQGWKDHADAHDRLQAMTAAEYEKTIKKWLAASEHKSGKAKQLFENSKRLLAAYRRFADEFLNDTDMADKIGDGKSSEQMAVLRRSVTKTLESIGIKWGAELGIPRYFRLKTFMQMQNAGVRRRLRQECREALDGLIDKKLIELDKWEQIVYVPIADGKQPGPKPPIVNSTEPDDETKTRDILNGIYSYLINRKKKDKNSPWIVTAPGRDEPNQTPRDLVCTLGGQDLDRLLKSGIEFEVLIFCFITNHVGCYIIPDGTLAPWLSDPGARLEGKYQRMLLTPPDTLTCRGFKDEKRNIGRYFKSIAPMLQWLDEKCPGWRKEESELAKAVDETGIANDKLAGIKKQITEILDHKRQIILHGPPGTGKTWLADRYVESVYVEKSDRDQYVRHCTFHPEYGYEHFIEGIRPQAPRETQDAQGPQNNNIVFKREDGIFKKLCEAADKVGEKKFYLIIDEINRGDIPRIFGELITLIEKDKRGKKTATLPLSGKEFTVPDNVYIIATMNTADRSIALLDTALRRRFGFLEMKPEYHHFKGVLPGKFKSDDGKLCDLATWFEALNKKLQAELHSRHDAEHILIGHSHFMVDESSKPAAALNKTILQRIIQYEIYPLIREYCYEDPKARDALEKFIKNSTDVPPLGSSSHESAQGTEATSSIPNEGVDEEGKVDE